MQRKLGGAIMSLSLKKMAYGLNKKGNIKNKSNKLLKVVNALKYFIKIESVITNATASIN